jgi:tyrosine decarboxylase/aspartate 1-decarboxylase
MTFPEQGRPAAEVRAALAERRRSLLDYRRSTALGLAGTAPPRLAIQVQADFSSHNPNNIGWHGADPVPGGPFGPTRALEAEVIAMLTDLVGGDPGQVGGYLSGGGTESNVMALWMARNVLTGGSPQRVSVLAGRSLHHSVPSACDIVGLGAGRWEACEEATCGMAEALAREGIAAELPVRHQHVPADDLSGLALVDLDDAWRLDVGDLECRIEEGLDSGVRAFAIIATVGTTSVGAIDPVESIGELVARMRRSRPDTRFFVHVDAAMGGLVVPFLASADRVAFGFDLLDPDGHPVVDSMSIDMHKAGLAPYPAGVFLCRLEHRRAVEVDRPFDPGQVDSTVSGSRSGAAAAVSWALLTQLGRRGRGGRGGYEALARRSITLARFTSRQLAAIGAHVAADPVTNIVAAELPAGRFDPRRVREVAGRYFLPALFLSRNESGCPTRAWRFCFLPHVRRSTLRAALEELAATADRRASA